MPVLPCGEHCSQVGDAGRYFETWHLTPSLYRFIFAFSCLFLQDEPSLHSDRSETCDTWGWWAEGPKVTINHCVVPFAAVPAVHAESDSWMRQAVGGETEESSCKFLVCLCEKKRKNPSNFGIIILYTSGLLTLYTILKKYIYMYFSLQLEQPCGGLRTDWCQLDCSTLYKLPLTFLKPAPSSWEFWNANWAAKSSLGECFGGWEVRHVGSAGSNKHCWVLAAARLRLHLALLSTLLHRSLGLTPPAPAWALHTRTHRCPQPLEGTAQEPNPRPLPLWWGLLTAAGEAGSHVMLMPTETAPITALIRPVRMKNSTWDGCSR